MKKRTIASLSEAQQIAFWYAWIDAWARPEQCPPTIPYEVWLILAGRGWGKTRTGAEWVRDKIETGQCRRMAGIAPTAGDARDVMVEGESGIIAISRPDFRPHYEPSKRRVTWPNGAILTLYSADEPSRLRGPQHDGAWCDEIATWRYCEEAWSNLLFGLRLGENPQVCVTTTPRPIKRIREFVAEAKDPNSGIVLTHGTTYENLGNLSSKFRRMIRRYEGTSVGRQELLAEVLSETPGALWTRKLIDDNRRDGFPVLLRVVVALDPAVTSGDESDETGLVVVGLGADGHLYVLRDATARVTPGTWAEMALRLYDAYGADCIVGEVNNGGDLVELNIRTQEKATGRHLPAPFVAVHASRGKVTRAQPVATLYERNLAHHVRQAVDYCPLDFEGNLQPGTRELGSDHLELLEDQLCTYTTAATWSPDRMDALVWAMTELAIHPELESESMVVEEDDYEISPI